MAHRPRGPPWIPVGDSVIRSNDSGESVRKRLLIIPLVAAAALVAGTLPASAADPISGAIFTTDVSGVPVNLNIYAAKEDVYLNGGPGINAPVGAAGLPAGTYSFQVTDPSGKTLLSTDAVSCRQFTVDVDVQLVLRHGCVVVDHERTFLLI